MGGNLFHFFYPFFLIVGNMSVFVFIAGYFSIFVLTGVYPCFFSCAVNIFFFFIPVHERFLYIRFFSLWMFDSQLVPVPCNLIKKKAGLKPFIYLSIFSLPCQHNSSVLSSFCFTPSHSLSLCVTFFTNYLHSLPVLHLVLAPSSFLSLNTFLVYLQNSENINLPC